MKSIVIRGKRKAVHKIRTYPNRWGDEGRVHYAVSGTDPLVGQTSVFLCGTPSRYFRRVGADAPVTCVKCAALDKEQQ